MATRHHDLPPRLNAPPPLTLPQPLAFDTRQPMYSSALSSSSLHHSPFPMNPQSMQTPLQPFFNAQPPGAPGRPTHHSRSSMSQLTSAGISPNGFPLRPMGQGHFSHPSMVIGAGPPIMQQFAPRSRRQPSLGGPPKAVLGGPARKLSPLPPPAASTPPATASQKSKKTIVNLPKETIHSDGAQPAAWAPWARFPMSHLPVLSHDIVEYPELTTCEPFLLDSWRYHIPNTIDVFLPGKMAWNALKQKVIEQKLEKLGVERGSGNALLHIHAPHARAASISSPADPALLFFKLNQLQLSQTGSTLSSLATSPQPIISPSSSLPPRLQNRHGHSMSLAQPTMFSSSTASNPFGPNAFLGSDQIDSRVSPGRSPSSPSALPSAALGGIHAPQGRIPVTLPTIVPPHSDTRPDFNVGFGLDIPEEEELEEDAPPTAPEVLQAQDKFVMDDSSPGDALQQTGDLEEADDLDGLTTASQTRYHSRHVSRLSGALSLRDVGGLVNADLPEETMVPLRSPIRNRYIDDLDQDAVGEWTGSEDLYLDNESSDDEWSNPSDEERARQQRVHRRLLHRAQQETEKPRRLPNFPRPPDNTIALGPRRDDDIISNPSEEEQSHMNSVEYLAREESDLPYARPLSNMSVSSPRHLPPLPHSRTGSGQISAHDPARAHSRVGSDHFGRQSPLPLSSTRRDSLNPFAKPFVFGSAPQTSVWAGDSFGGVHMPPSAPLSRHSHHPSFGKPLNAAAQEFKPGGFTFRPPPGVPQLTFPAVTEVCRLQADPPVGPSPGRTQQGREKRQRRASSASADGEDTINSFRFPHPSESPQSIRRSAPATPRVTGSHMHNSLNASAEPFILTGHSSSVTASKDVASLSHSLMANAGSPDETLHDDSTAKAEIEPLMPTDVPGRPVSKSKRAPIPLDFKHPVSSNTVPAGLFKALVNSGEDRTRRSVRSRLSSHDVFEHVSRPSLDDLDVPHIAHKISRTRLATDPSYRGPADDVFGPCSPHGLLNSPDNSPGSGPSGLVMDFTERFQDYERRLGALLDKKLEAVHRDIIQYKETSRAQPVDPSVKDMLSELVSLFRAQLRDSATRDLEDSQTDARGEIDFGLIKDVMQQGHAESQAMIKLELNNMFERMGQTRASAGIPDTSVFEQLNARTIKAVVGAVFQLSERIAAIERIFPSLEPEALISKFMSTLTPVIASLRSDKVDYDYLTRQLTQAVKPHISQLIDLASDKRETAGLIVDRIMPLLSSIHSPAPVIDTNSVAGQLTAEIRRLTAPIDAFEIKEQVADLVVERLDSRLAVRDRTFNIDTVTGRVTEGVTRLLEPMHEVTNKVTTTLATLVESHQTLATHHHDLSAAQKDVVILLGDLPAKLVTATEALGTAQAEFSSRQATSSSQSDDTLHRLKSAVDDLSNDQKAFSLHYNELLTLHKDVLEQLNALPETLVTATNVLQSAHAEFALSRDTSKRDLDEMRKLNTDHQVQLAKARGAHGQVRVEKDVLNEKLNIAEGDRDRLRAEVKQLQLSAASKSAEGTALEARNSELEEALSKALARLQASDVTAQAARENIAELEQTIRDLGSEKQTLKSKVDSLELQATFASRDKEAAAQGLAFLQKQYDHLSSQMSHWDDLRRTSEQIETLTTIIGQVDNEEIRELRRLRDHSKVVEAEYDALQKRFKDQENRAANSERVAASARQNLAQAQQRASEWELRAKELQSKLELTQTKLDQADQTQAQLETDYSLVKLQLEEANANDRLSKDREARMLQQIASLEAKVTHLQAEPEQGAASNALPVYQRRINGNGYISRASTPISRLETPVAKPNGRVSSPSSLRSEVSPKQSVWDSMHAPSHGGSVHSPAPSRYPSLGGPTSTTPKVRRAYFRPSIPSPTPSTVSLAPTQDEDGWYGWA